MIERPKRIDWQAERDRIDLAAVVTGILGPSPGRRGERGRLLWWSCPFHSDANPSFSIEPGKPWWRCYGCGKHGDAATLVMELEGVGFPEAINRLTGRSTASGTTRPRPSPTTKTEPKPSGLPETEALALVAEAEARLWTPEGSEALAYLTGRRKLTPETIRVARLGWSPGVRLTTREGRC
jgi:DNA primase